MEMYMCVCNRRRIVPTLGHLSNKKSRLSALPQNICGPGQRSWYSESLRAGRSGDRIPVRARFPAPIQTVPGSNLPSHYMGTGSFTGVRGPRRGVDHPPHLTPRLKKEYSYTSILPLGLCGLF